MPLSQLLTIADSRFNASPRRRLLQITLTIHALCCIATIASAQRSIRDEDKQGSFYFYWGYNRASFSRTNLHFNGPDYDFTLYDIRAKDRPSPFGSVYFNPATFSVPQYNYRLGYFLTSRFHLSAGVDHMKYVVTPGQQVRMSGVITREASEQYAGSYLNTPVTLDPSLLSFEHTDGFNLVSVDAEYLIPVARLWKGRVALGWNAGIGGIWMVTKTDVRIFGDGLDNDFHVAGYALAAKTGPRLEFLGRAFAAAEFKTGYATLPSVLIKNSAPEIGDHNVMFYERYVVAGYNFRLQKQKKRALLDADELH